MACLVGKLSALCAGTLVVCLLAWAGDWLSAGGDPQHSGWQRHGKRLDATTVKELKRLWKLQLDAGPLTAPVIVGPTITHRGVRELAFIGGGQNNLFAIDADLGTLFWKRHFEADTTPGRAACGSGTMGTPVIEPDPDEDLSGEAVADESQEDDDDPGRMRPVFAVAGDGRLHVVRPSDGADMEEPVRFLPAHANTTPLNLWSGRIYAATSGGCAGAPDGLWAIPAKAPHGTLESTAMKDVAGIVIAGDGSLFLAGAEKIVRLEGEPWQMKNSFTAKRPVVAMPVAFTWQGRGLIATSTQDELYVLDAAKLNPVAAAESGSGLSGRPATWRDSAGARWIVAGGQKIRAFRLSGSKEHPKLERIWESAETGVFGPPVVTNNVVFSLTGDSPAVLVAFNATTGKPLYSSGASIASTAQSGELAVANGHVCFSATDRSVYCFGIPID